MRVHVTCENCGSKCTLERRIVLPERVRLTCPGCESILDVIVTAEHLQRRQEPSYVKAAPS